MIIEGEERDKEEQKRDKRRTEWGEKRGQTLKEELQHKGKINRT